MAAAASLYRLTGRDSYRLAFEGAWGSGKELTPISADGAWEYANSLHPSANSDTQAKIRRSFVRAATEIAQSQATSAYPSMKHPYAPLGWGQGLVPDYNTTQLFIRAHLLSSNPLFLRVMQVASAQILGANQIGLSFTTGLGRHNIKHPLHEDHRAMGVAAPRGITVYGWAPQSKTNYEWVFGPDWAPLSEADTRTGVANRHVDPNRFSMPLYEYLIEHPLVIMQQEYTVHQTIGTTAAMWLYLHAVSAGGAMHLGVDAPNLRTKANRIAQ